MLHTVDPAAPSGCCSTRLQVDRAGATTLDSWAPSKEGDACSPTALRGRHRGVGAAGHRRRHRRARRRTDRPGPLLPRGLAAGRRGLLTTCAGSTRRCCPRTRRNITGGSGCTGSDTTGRRRHGARRGLDKTNYYGVSVVDGRALAGHRRGPRAPHPATTCGWPTCPPAHPRRPKLRVVQQGVDAQTSVHVGRDGRVYVFTEPGRPSRPAGGDQPGAAVVRDLGGSRARGPRGGARGYAILDGRRWTRRCCCGLDPARGQRGVGAPTWAPAPPARRAAARAGLDRRHRRAAEGGTRRGSATPTTSPVERLPSYDALSGETTLWGQAPGQATYPLWSPARSCARRPTARRCGVFVLAPAAEPDRPRPTISMATAGFGGADGRRPTRRGVWPGWRPAASTRSPTCAAGRRRARAGTGRDARAQAERLRRLPRRREPWWPGAGPPRTSWRSRAGPTAGCSSARR